MNPGDRRLTVLCVNWNYTDQYFNHTPKHHGTVAFNGTTKGQYPLISVHVCVGLFSDSAMSMAENDNSKKKGGCICPICLETIIESTKTKPGHDAIFCEGHYCNSWLHRKCAGLPKPLFTILVNSSDPYICPHCQLQNVTAEISKLKEVNYHTSVI